LYLLGNTDVAHYEHLRFWAERGLIHMEDARDNSYKIFTVRTILHRIRALNDMLGNTRAGRQGFMHEDKVRTIQDFIDRMTDLCKKAQEQGMPEDPSARRDLVRRRPKTVVWPEGKMRF